MLESLLSILGMRMCWPLNIAVCCKTVNDHVMSTYMYNKWVNSSVCMCLMIMIDFSFSFSLGLILLLRIKCGFHIAVIISCNILPGNFSSLHLLQHQLEEGESPEDLTPDRSLCQGHRLENQHVKTVGYLEEAHANTWGRMCKKKLSTCRI